ncbi:autophagy-related protein 11 [Cannabis sativa]|uniref:autophagy-related protein 11 n=1 Tax=Cannabis sativa TaxID=3483 RepID=UPI0029CA6994|nr:autophagy-related protein 11 [Cannabis sativa]
MSSTVTGEGLIHQGKLLIHIAENGRSLVLECDESTLVEKVMRSIESVSGISFGDQLVLCLDMKLEPQRPLSAYKLPATDREVFIYNKSRLHHNSPTPPPEQVEVFDNLEPQSPPSSRDSHPLDDALDPALKALPSYERQFRYHCHRGNAIFDRTLAKYGTCERLLRELKVQERALEIATGNLDQYYKVITQNCRDFMKRFSMQHRWHSDLLANFGRDVEKLRGVKLHPLLQTSTRKCLLDFVKEENLRKSAENCSSSHRQFESKVSQFKQMFNEIHRKMDEVFSSRASLPIRNLEQMIKDHQRFINEQKSIMQSLSKDVGTVKKLVDDCLSCQLSSSLRPHDAVSALGPMYDVHDKSHLPKMEACERTISKLLDYCVDKKNEMNMFVHNYMQKVTYVSYNIKDAKFQFPVFREAMARQDDIFAELKFVRGIAPAYRACLAEVVRRKANMKLYMGMAGQLAERLATKREVEVRTREEFLKKCGSYVPKDVLASMGLFDTPNQCDVNIAPFDTHLLDIDIGDLDRYAPEYLGGFSSKGEKHGTFKASSSMSNDSSHSVEAEDSSATELLVGCESEELYEGSELFDIAGTSKLEVENAKLKAELASKIALICAFCPEIEFESLDDSKMDSLLKNAADKTAEALHQKDEYERHLHSMLKMKQLQCESYEKRIKELENELSNNRDVNDFGIMDGKNDVYKSQTLGGGETHIRCLSTSEPMDEVSCISNSLESKLGLFSNQACKGRDGVDENMMDSSGVHNPQLDSSMIEPHRDGDKDGKDKMAGQLGMSLTCSSTAESMPEPSSVLPCEAAAERGLDSKVSGNQLLELRSALAEKSNQLSETEAKLEAAMEEVVMLKTELETSRKLLDESQMNCAHLENCLHEAREEAHTHLCAAERRASEYSALRASTLKMRSLFERLKTCVYAPGGVPAFADALRILAQSLANSINENEDDGTADFRKCIRVLADRVGFLSRHRDELLDKYPKVEAASEQLRKELEEKKELVNTLYAKHQLEKQANKEKISFGRMQVHEIAAFVLNTNGHYEAINRNCSNYYLSSESVALFTDHLPGRPNYIVGQIVHIESQTVKQLATTLSGPEHNLATEAGTDRLTLNSGSTSNPYGLPIGCEYFVVTIAMLPDTAIHSPPSSTSS